MPPSAPSLHHSHRRNRNRIRRRPLKGSREAWVGRVECRIHSTWNDRVGEQNGTVGEQRCTGIQASVLLTGLVELGPKVVGDEEQQVLAATACDWSQQEQHGQGHGYQKFCFFFLPFFRF